MLTKLSCRYEETKIVTMHLLHILLETAKDCHHISTYFSLDKFIIELES